MEYFVNRANPFFIALAISLVTNACSNLPATLRPYADGAPEEVLEAVDARLYSPIDDGLEKLDALLEVDLAGFFPPEQRPKQPVWVPVKLTWARGQARFETGKWPKDLAPLQDRLLEFLAGKETDLIRRSFSDVMQGYRLALRATEDGNLLVNAVLPENPQRKIKILVDERLFIARMEIQSEETNAVSVFEYDDTEPANVSKITSVYGGNGQPTTVAVSYAYGRFEGYILPTDITYAIRIGSKELPPFRMRVKKYQVN